MNNEIYSIWDKSMLKKSPLVESKTLKQCGNVVGHLTLRRGEGW
jgi:hypothetical protein